jgi:AraC-like DNA-binding protein
LYDVRSRHFLVEMAIEPGRITARQLAAGPGWTVDEVVCSCGPANRPYPEQHDRASIAIVTSGTFQYRASGSNGREVMTPGSILLGSPGQAFECGHEHGTGDRCLSFGFQPGYFETIAAGSGVTDLRRIFCRCALTVAGLAREAGLSPFHFLRTFELTGVTPHQYLRRARLRAAAAARLMDGPGRILDVALDAGFGDVSNFNHAFRAEFGASPTAYRRHRARPTS